MNGVDVFQLLKKQFEAIDAKMQALTDSIKRDCTAQEVDERLKQLATAWDQAHVNYIKAGNAIFEANDATIKQLSKDLVAAQGEMKAALANLQDVKTTLDKISQAVAIGTSLVGMGAAGRV